MAVIDIAVGEQLAHDDRRHTAPAAQASPRSSPSVSNLQVLTETQLLLHHCPAAVLTNDKGDIAYISGKTGKYLEPAAGSRQS